LVRGRKEKQNKCIWVPFGFLWQLERSLRWINQDDLRGLDFVTFEDEWPELVGPAPEWVVRTGAETRNVRGWYVPPNEQRQPYIMLYTRSIYRGVPALLWWSTVPVLRITHTLAHEVAHHLVATRGYVFTPAEKHDDEEQLAERYALNVLDRMTRNWSYRLGQKCLKELAFWHYAFGAADWNHRKYSSAADQFYTAWDLDRSHTEAAYWYQRAREKCDLQTVQSD
jgi:hypothetical protein